MDKFSDSLGNVSCKKCWEMTLLCTTGHFRVPYSLSAFPEYVLFAAPELNNFHWFFFLLLGKC